MTQERLPFQYQSEKKDSSLTSFAGLPLFVEFMQKIGFIEAMEQTLQMKKRGWEDSELIVSLILLNLAGGDCIKDIERLESDGGLSYLMKRFRQSEKQDASQAERWRGAEPNGLPSNASIHRYLDVFHHEGEESKREEGVAFIPEANEPLEALTKLNEFLVGYAQKVNPSDYATLDQDATLIRTQKKNARYCYKGYKAYQPFNTYWAEQGIFLDSEFRDGNVNAGYEQLRVFKEVLSRLPQGITRVGLRSDSAGYQAELIKYCAQGEDERFGRIDYAIAAKVSHGIKAETQRLKEGDWHVMYEQDARGEPIETGQSWAEVGYVPDWVVGCKGAYRYIVIREAMAPSKKTKKEAQESLPFQTIDCGEQRYKLFALVTNRKEDGAEVIRWHRERCGKSEQAHSLQKSDLAGGQMPSNRFGVNAAWWQITVLSFNLNRLFQMLVLPDKFKKSKMKALRFYMIHRAARIVNHARVLYLTVEKTCYEWFEYMRHRIGRCRRMEHYEPTGS